MWKLPFRFPFRPLWGRFVHQHLPHAPPKSFRVLIKVIKYPGALFYFSAVNRWLTSENPTHNTIYFLILPG